ncbi:aspartic proteinase CDR1-like [Papaver somniferum]|uniref:aspartic proteinase CDR1-like n=1 Tax=Papaver somniferum TaxID=3469 RepID=UPI000E6FC2CF|nr:aspartic proteinase CDR1-like [Papaver somniferum]
MGKPSFDFLPTIVYILLLLISVASVNAKKGFSLKMIHRDSKESPLYPGNHLTRDERLQRFVEQSKAQVRYIESQMLLQKNATRSMDPEVARLPVVYESTMFYVAAIGLGTFPGRRQSYMNYYLMIDSGSDQSWLQCEGATKAFNQNNPLYPWRSSTTYRPVPCNTHPFCRGDKCNDDGQCTYLTRYASGSITSGIVAEEKFTLGSDTSGIQSIELHIGCGFRQENFENVMGNNHLHGKPDLIAGILGLGLGQWSFLNQLGAIGQGKFSHCLQTFDWNIEGPSTYLRFGADAIIGGVGQRVHKTPIVVPWFQTPLYYLNLEDISVGTKRVRFPRGTFKVNIKGEGGAIIDSGTPLSMMYKDHFDKIADLVKAHFNKLGIEYIGSVHHFDVCFRIRGRFDTANYPSITLHFQQADYVISDYKANFLMVTADGIVCLAFFRGNSTGLGMPHFILGAMQQTNKRILYDVMDRSLSFVTEYCEQGS